ncbi:MAG: GntR family transcriptional regulator [Lachnospiraceae bacterium]|jgi:DNA-binding transcriptional regulator YhcF (GntR family)|nr:GntR family transcriptional regulator [Lachnospiraceae bacterium]MBQ6354629.1 GntR family transcriptional regulator [Lachnospiraceae bacterium]
MKWEFKSGIPIYLQIISLLKMKIAAGELPPGSQVQPVRELAMEAGVNPNTMQRALTQLEQEGLLYTQRTSGRFVTEDKQVLKEMRKSLSEQYVKDLFEALGKIGMNREEIIEAVSSFESTDEKEA